jgi:hypothetical protein
MDKTRVPVDALKIIFWHLTGGILGHDVYGNAGSYDPFMMSYAASLCRFITTAYGGTGHIPDIIYPMVEFLIDGYVTKTIPDWEVTATPLEPIIPQLISIYRRIDHISRICRYTRELFMASIPEFLISCTWILVSHGNTLSKAFDHRHLRGKTLTEIEYEPLRLERDAILSVHHIMLGVPLITSVDRAYYTTLIVLPKLISTRDKATIRLSIPQRDLIVTKLRPNAELRARKALSAAHEAGFDSDDILPCTYVYASESEQRIYSPLDEEPPADACIYKIRVGCHSQTFDARVEVPKEGGSGTYTCFSRPIVQQVWRNKCATKKIMCNMRGKLRALDNAARRQSVITEDTQRVTKRRRRE